MDTREGHNALFSLCFGSIGHPRMVPKTDPKRGPKKGPKRVAKRVPQRGISSGNHRAREARPEKLGGVYYSIARGSSALRSSALGALTNNNSELGVRKVPLPTTTGAGGPRLDYVFSLTAKCKPRRAKRAGEKFWYFLSQNYVFPLKINGNSPPAREARRGKIRVFPLSKLWFPFGNQRKTASRRAKRAGEKFGYFLCQNYGFPLEIKGKQHPGARSAPGKNLGILTKTR